MKLVDIQKQLKNEYNFHVVPVQCGYYFNVFNEDTNFFSEAFKFKVYEKGTNLLTGFPINRINYYEKKFLELKLDYAFVEQEYKTTDTDIGAVSQIIRVVTRSSNKDTIGNKFTEIIKSSKHDRLRENLIAILNGFDPLTGEIFQDSSVWKHDEVVRLLKEILDQQNLISQRHVNNLVDKKNELSELQIEVPEDYFLSEKIFFKIEELDSYTPCHPNNTYVKNFILENLSYLRDQNKQKGFLLNRGFPTTKEEVKILLLMYDSEKSLDELEKFFQRSRITILSLLSEQGKEEIDGVSIKELFTELIKD
jgi:DNA mismatch repair ATPase MutS